MKNTKVQLSLTEPTKIFQGTGTILVYVVSMNANGDGISFTALIGGSTVSSENARVLQTGPDGIRFTITSEDAVWVLPVYPENPQITQAVAYVLHWR